MERSPLSDVVMIKYLCMYREENLAAGAQYDCYVPSVWAEFGYTRDIKLARRFETAAEAQAYLDTGGEEGIPYARPIMREGGSAGLIQAYGWHVRQIWE